MAVPKSATIENLKVPPHSIEAEQAVLGGLLLAPRAWEQIADIVQEADFYREDHRLVFRAIHELSDQAKPCDALTVTEWFESHGLVDRIDGGAYISQLASSTPSAATIRPGSSAVWRPAPAGGTGWWARESRSIPTGSMSSVPT